MLRLLHNGILAQAITTEEKLKSAMPLVFKSFWQYMIALRNKVLLNFFFSLSASAIGAQKLNTVSYVDLNRYAGKWFEIASFPQRFQKGCTATTAEYSLTEKGYLIVENRCNKRGRGGKQSYIKGKVFTDKNSGNAKLKVQFFWPFRGKYWIIDLADDYSYAVVGHPNRKYLWILSRNPIMDDILYEQITNRVKAMGFDISKLKHTSQNIRED
jgi:apolipoprotein D and lipocalin family protein